MSFPQIKINEEVDPKTLPNPHYVNAPYEGVSLFLIPRSPNLSRRRWLKRKRRFWRALNGRAAYKLLPPVWLPSPKRPEHVLPVVFKRAEYRGESDFE